MAFIFARHNNLPTYLPTYFNPQRKGEPTHNYNTERERCRRRDSNQRPLKVRDAAPERCFAKLTRRQVVGAYGGRA